MDGVIFPYRSVRGNRGYLYSCLEGESGHREMYPRQSVDIHIAEILLFFLDIAGDLNCSITPLTWFHVPKYHTRSLEYKISCSGVLSSVKWA